MQELVENWSVLQPTASNECASNEKLEGICYYSGIYKPWLDSDLMGEGLGAILNRHGIFLLIVSTNDEPTYLFGNQYQTTKFSKQCNLYI